MESDFKQIRAFKDYDNLEYYLSESHWNFHVNLILYQNLLVFHNGEELGIFLDVSRNKAAQPVKDYTPLYGKLFNEAYRMCHDVLTAAVPEIQVARLAHQAATWKFRNLKDTIVAPNVIDLIESYHIMCMANVILTLANDQSDKVTRFLTALSVYNDTGLPFCMEQHQFRPYNQLYQYFIYATVKDGTYLRPGYDVKWRDEYLHNNMVWYYNIEKEVNESKMEEKAQKSNEPNTGGNTSKTSSKPTSFKEKKDNKGKTKPYTLTYFIHDNQSILTAQTKRVNIVFKKLMEWNWINKDTTADDFFSFFEGKPRHCNIKWTATNCILTYLMIRLLEQPYIKKQIGCSARSIVILQFGKNPDNKYNRLDDATKSKVKIVLNLLDVTKPLPEKRGASGFSTESDIDTRDKALQEIYSGNMHVGKHT